MRSVLALTADAELHFTLANQHMSDALIRT